MNTLITYEDVHPGYTAPVAAPLSFTVNPGEVVGLCGPNGVGKSTFLRVLTGQARVFGGRVARRPGLHLSHQHQRPSDVQGLPVTVREALGLMGVNAPPPALEHQWRTRLDRLSGGQLQWVMIWAALAGPAELVLLDEPTNNLDPAGLGALTKHLTGDLGGKGVLLVSHDKQFVDRVCTRTVEVRREL